ncbi:MAG: response regulator [Anaerolineae bacterium]|nr:response regulator [Gloeobacterales cyanobacterium ES-bin-313]
MQTILVIDDILSELELISQYLKEAGFHVLQASDAQEGMTKAREQKPNVVVTDVVMPGMSGLELCRSLKGDPTTHKLPIVACTSKNQEIDRLWGMKQGIDVYVTKPFTREQLIRAVRSLVD